MKLYFFPVAPNPTRLRLYLAEKEQGGTAIPLEEVVVNLPRGEQKSEEFARKNPLKRLPVLELEDGSFLTESLAIIEYFEELYPEPPMIGRDALERARVREVERIAHGALEQIGGIVHATNSPLGLPTRPEVAETLRGRLAASLEVLEGRMADGRAFLAGDRPTVADFALAAGFQFARFGKVAIDPGHAKLMAWDERYRERPAAQAVLVA